MKFPEGIGRFTISKDKHEFLPSGYLAIEETNDGGGDNCGLYWEIGREENLPMVCLWQHEGSLLIPEFRDFTSFLEWFEKGDGSAGPTMNLNDDDFFIPLMNKGKVLTKNGRMEEAIEKLERSVSLFGEYSESWYLLSENYYKTGQKEKGDSALINSISSNFFFGLPAKKAIDRFNELQTSGTFQNHPMVKKGTNWIKGSDFATPISVDYDLMLEIIQDLLDSGDFRTGMLMSQNYGMLMSRETEDITRRYNFEPSKWFEQFSVKLFSIYPERIY